MTFGGSLSFQRSRVLMLCAAFALATGAAPAASQAPLDAAGDPACTIEGTAGDDELVGTAGDDVLCGYGGDDTLEGRGGNDILLGGPGNDLLAGNAGNDELFGHAGEDWLFGGPGDDLLGGGGDADLLHGGIGNDELHGGGGGDTVIGQDGDDELWGGSGADKLEGRAGNDTLKGGPGKDQLSGNAGNDFLFGQAAGDTLRGGPGIDVLAGGGGNDVVRGGGADDELHGEDGADRLLGGDDNDLMWGGPGDDTIEGQLGNDTLRGGSDNDLLAGNEGNDELLGGTGDDELFGGPGTDTCDGGLGTDTLVDCAVNPPSIEEPFAFGTTLVGTPTPLAGRAFDHFSGGVVAVTLAIQHRATGHWLQADGTFGPQTVYLVADLEPWWNATFWEYEVALADGDYALALLVEDSDGYTDELPRLWEFRVSATPTVSGIVLDAAGDSGRWSSIQLDAAGNPVIAYTQWPTGDPAQAVINLIHCTIPDCSEYAGPNFVTAVSVSGGGGPQETDAVDLELDTNGNPVIAANGTIARCVDPVCADAATVFLIGGMSLELDADDYPVVSGGWGLQVTHCTDAICTGSVTESISVNGEELWSSLALDSSGNPVVASWDWSSDLGSDLRLARCSDPYCQDSFTSELLEIGFSEVDWKSVSLVLDSNDYPVIATKQQLADSGYIDNPRVLHCSDVACSGPVSMEPVAVNSVAGRVSLAVDSSDKPVVAFADWLALMGQRDAVVAFCTDATCSAVTVKVVDNQASAKQLAVVVDGAGNAYVTYYDATAGDLRFGYVAAP